jgi:hypothetical protein
MLGGDASLLVLPENAVIQEVEAGFLLDIVDCEGQQNGARR